MKGGSCRVYRNVKGLTPIYAIKTLLPGWLFVELSSTCVLSPASQQAPTGSQHVLKESSKIEIGVDMPEDLNTG